MYSKILFPVIEHTSNLDDKKEINHQWRNNYLRQGLNKRLFN
jgi:hypothetical protein